MVESDLTTPLGTDPKPAAKRFSLPLLPIAGGLIGIVFLVAVTWVLVVEDPLGGEPFAVAHIQSTPTAGMSQTGMSGMSAQEPTVLPEPQDAPGPASVAGGGPQIIHFGQNANSAGTEPSSGEVVIHDLSAGGNSSALSVSLTPDPALIENTPFGPLPRIASSGEKPIDAYSRPAPQADQNAPKIAILVGGLGMSQTGTQEAIRQLPPDVTLAFAPYGNSLPRWASRARQEGHEIVLQVPLEPFDFPDNDPGPHTLLTGLSPEANRERLHWLMARISAYAGIMNHMGARFTASTATVQPFFQELVERGLYYIDDGSSSRSVAGRMADEMRLPFARGDVTIDSIPNKDEIDARLLQLENLARTHGYAVGIASALPISVDRISEWAKTLKDRGILLVPASALAKEYRG
ncbi:MAG: divergent polysaccharide deacetylase family protein [Hyphomicrobiales bacterium]|nr:divergent polysaccharide deacetylase family protein [Hyphomicrobiales bacterium]